MRKVKLGKKFRFEYIPFSELVNPWKLAIGENAFAFAWNPNTTEVKVSTSGSIARCNSRALKTMKRDDLDALKYSIMQFGLLKPFEVVELTEKMRMNASDLKEKEKYVIVDGQRRYYALWELLDFQLEWQRHTSYSEPIRGGIEEAKESKKYKRLQEKYQKLDIRDFVLIPCLVYPYKTFLQCMRHSIEDNKFSVRPSRGYLEIAERMQREGLPDLKGMKVEKQKKEIKKQIIKKRKKIQKKAQTEYDKQVDRYEKEQRKQEEQVIEEELDRVKERLERQRIY